MICYNCGAGLMFYSLQCPSCAQPIFTYLASSRPGKGRRLDGCRQGTASPTDFVAVPNLNVLSSSVDLRAELSPVEDQGQVGSCAANAVVGALEHQQRLLGLPAVDLSRLFVYYNARVISGDQEVDRGTYLSNGFAAVLALGAPPESSWPYDPAQVSTKPSDAAFADARANVPAEYARVDGLEHIKGALARRHPVTFGITLPERCYQEAWQTGRIPRPTASEMSQATGGHAMLLVGYDDNDGTFLVRNSWGESWGDKGYARLDYETFQSGLHEASTWILGKLEGAGDFTVVRPKLKVPDVQGGVKDLGDRMVNDLRDSLMKDLEKSFADIRNRMTPGGGGR